MQERPSETRKPTKKKPDLIGRNVDKRAFLCLRVDGVEKMLLRTSYSVHVLEFFPSILSFFATAVMVLMISIFYPRHYYYSENGEQRLESFSVSVAGRPTDRPTDRVEVLCPE